MLRTLLGLIAVLMLAGAAQAQEAVARATYDEWSVYREQSGGETICWVATEPILGTGLVDRASPVIMYTVNWGEFSFVLRRGEFPADEGRLRVGKTDFPVFFRGGEGWLEHGDTDARALRSFRGARQARFIAGSEGFMISLEGFERALSAAARMCNRKPSS